MKNWKLAAGSLFFLFAFLFSGSASAHVIDEVQEKQAAAGSYEDYYTLQQQYTGESGVTFESYSKDYSKNWKTVEELKALEQELLKNKTGEELAYLGKVKIFSDYPAGKGVLGQYYASYEHGGNIIRYSDDRVIELYGGNDYGTPEAMATTLSHEYGHHFTYYHLIVGERVLPENWLSSQYAQERGLSSLPDVHVDGSGEYQWSMPEILAEDYVQLFGTESAIKDHMQMNGHIDTPFDNPSIRGYWNDLLTDREYPLEENPSLYVTDFEKSPYNRYDLKLYGQNLNGQNTYVVAQDDNFAYSPVQILQWTGEDEQEGWVRHSQLDSEKSWVLNGEDFNGVRLQAVQHNADGFNRGSATYKLAYENINETVKTKEQIHAYQQMQLTVPEIKEMLTEVANEKGIPAEILKAIAYVETGFQQFDENGEPLITADGGIGMMQITMSDEEYESKGIDKEKVKYDIRYNIEVGADILLEKWDLRLPTINNHDKNSIEDWYFAVMAYNGLSKRNDPNLNEDAYQERVYDIIRNRSLLEIGQTPEIDISYPHEDKPDIIVFGETSNYKWPTQTRTTQNYQVGDMVYSQNPHLSYSNLRDGVDGSVSKKLKHYNPLEIIGGPFETTSNPENQYAMYKVKGTGFEGYIASSNIVEGNINLFPDVNREEVATAVAYLQHRDIINGYTDGTFRPETQLLRRHAASLIVKALDMKLPQGYEMKATDMAPGQLGYEDMLIAEAHGLMGSGGALRPNETLTRAQMAAILVRAFDEVYEEPTQQTSFTDQNSFWNYDDINTLAHNNITVADPFRPNEAVKRSQFALFLERTIKLMEE